MRRHTGLWMWGLVLLLSGFSPRVAIAQEAEAPETYMVTVRPGVEMRSRAGEVWYVVAMLDEGQVLRVVGERDGWLAVEYPPTTPAVAPLERVEIREDAQGNDVVVLTRASPLLCYNASEPTRERSYISVFTAQPLPAGTTLPILGRVERIGGGLGGYLVDPPRGAVGYVLPVPENVRTASQDQIEAFLIESGWGAEEEQASTEDATVIDNGSDADDVPVDDDGSDESDAPDSAEPVDPSPVEGEPDPGAESDDPLAAIDRALRGLDEAMVRVLKEPLEGAEIGPLIDAYRSLVRDLPEDDSGALYRDAVSARLRLLELRVELQRVQREALTLRERVASTPDQEAVERSASLGYEAVGRLMPSLIYDGSNLPLLYRIVTVDGVTGRTIAYVAPREGLELASLVGSIVGVHGEATTEQDRRIPVLRPERIDELRSGA